MTRCCVVANKDVDTHLLVEEDERQHGPAQAPLVGAVLEQGDLEQGREDVREQLRPLPQVLADRLSAKARRIRVEVWELGHGSIL